MNGSGWRRQGGTVPEGNSVSVRVVLVEDFFLGKRGTVQGIECWAENM